MADMQNLVERLEKAVGRLEAVSHSSGMHGGCGDSSPKGGLAPYVEVFDSLLAGPAADYLRISKEIGGDVQKHAEMVHTGLKMERSLLVTASQCQQPDGGPTAKELSGISSGPSAPPPPPPGPPPPPISTSSSCDESASRSALFAQINQGEGITHALKHVSDDMKTHKNPALKSQSGPVRSGPKPFTAPKPAGGATPKPATKKEPPVLELEGKKWRVENQENVSNLVINDTELKQVAYIYKCVSSTLHIRGKINSITLDNCKKLGLVFDDVVGIVEIINSRDIKVQVMGKVPTISINKTDGCHIYLSKNSLDCEIVSAKSSEMNVLIPTESGDFNEFPVPEQFKTLWNGQKLVTTVTEIAG
ncbi:adenylyl cyclase-associated protein 1 isoform X4 [Gracilinanus agilis]|uniref:adenylyl cyclase-associated protein 1 isoform X4 n=1 Tax=Gracilinanus agilis TaxID=191870 RepID=UPI001CFEDE12|nr:adenylyl cyclase-associated protein 1 isoform X4 [Gracilinanus agilis]